MILAFETATDVCSVAFKDAAGNLHERRTRQRGSHSEKLFLFIEELMDEHGFGIPDLEAVVVSEGPGSYTGLRISASAVKGLLFQTKIPLYAVDSLAGFARSAMEQDSGLQTVHSVIDARRVHLYHQKFSVQNGRPVAETEVDILAIEKIEPMFRDGEGLIGSGIGRLNEEVLAGMRVFGEEKISARSLIALYNEGGLPFTKQVDPAAFEPNYYTSRQEDG